MRLSESKITGLLLALIVVVQLSFGLSRLARYSAVDEHLWTYERIPQFWQALAQARFKKTDINDKPGITTAWIAGLGMLSVDPQPYEDSRLETKTSAQAAFIEKINIVFRLPIYFFTLCLLPVFYFLIRKLLGPAVALFATAIIYLSPIILGISLIINPDSLFWIFLPLSLVSFLIFQKGDRHRYAVLAGFFFGLALLTKYVAAILFVYLPVLIFFTAVSSDRIRDVRDFLRRSLVGYAQAVLAALVTVAVLYPAAWVRPETILETTFLSHPFAPIWKPYALVLFFLYADTFLLQSLVGSWIVRWLAAYRRIIMAVILGIALLSLSYVFIDTYSGMRLYDFQSMLASALIKSEVDLFATIALQGIATGFFVLSFSIPPIVLFLFCFALMGGIIALWRRAFHEELVIMSSILLFMFLYYATSALNSVQATVRYQIALYPLAAIIAAIGLRALLLRVTDAAHAVPRLAASVGLIGLLSVSLFLIRPYYFSYASALLPQQYVVNMKDMGDGSYEAAQYLNAQPGAEQRHIWSDKVAVCEYFVGSCTVSLKPKNLEDVPFDFFVISNGREPKTRYFISIRNIVSPEFLRLQELYASDDFDGHTIMIDGRPGNFVKIVNGASLR